MKLPIKPVFLPMEAQVVDDIPRGDNWQYEPKWDGFRCLAFRDGDEVELQSKTGQPMARYFPELVEALRDLKPEQFVIDGEIVIPEGSGVSFDSLLMRIHPAASRIRKLSKESPGMLIVFDILVDDKSRLLTNLPLHERRGVLEQFARKYFNRGFGRIQLSPATTDYATAKKWFGTVGSTLDGIVAKRADFNYRSGERTGMQKVKRHDTVDCIVGGFRYATNKRVVGSLLLGLYDKDGLLHHVGFTSGIKAADRETLTAKLEPLIQPPGFTGRAPGGPSRWSTERSSEWTPLAPKLVVEVSYDHFTGGRFRHGTRLLRWRPDKSPRQCTMDQLRKARAGSLKLLERKVG
ncbi:MAG TPA: ATP-dependent DNA ligase [Terriglobia bacterium]|nr:ATP-dependent DNA ligase [Terriglobia bacterium]